MHIKNMPYEKDVTVVPIIAKVDTRSLLAHRQKIGMMKPQEDF